MGFGPATGPWCGHRAFARGPHHSCDTEPKHAVWWASGGDTLEQLLPLRHALLGVDETGVSLHSSGGGGDGGGLVLPPGAQHLTLDFL